MEICFFKENWSVLFMWNCGGPAKIEKKTSYMARNF
jgi:hypothetical protein